MKNKPIIVIKLLIIITKRGIKLREMVGDNQTKSEIMVGGGRRSLLINYINYETYIDS